MGIFSRFKNKAAARPETFRGPATRRLYAIGDIHGRADLLEQLLAKIDEDRDGSSRPVDLIFLGDYVDRGDESARVIDICIQRRDAAKSDPTIANIVYLMGNHEEAMLAFLDDGADGAAWLSYGGMATVMSYRAKGPANPTKLQDFEILSDELAKVLPQDHREFLTSLSANYQAGDYFFVHAAVHPKLRLEDQSKRTFYWGDDSFLQRPWCEPFRVVHGHTITPEPDVKSFRVGVDTGAYYSGKLTAICIDGEDVRFLSTGDK